MVKSESDQDFPSHQVFTVLHFHPECLDMILRFRCKTVRFDLAKNPMKCIFF